MIIPTMKGPASRRRRLPAFLVLALGLAAGCGGAQSQEMPAEPPAVVDGEPHEDQLTTVRLTEEAERRLAIETTAITEQVIDARRTVGGEVIIPPGRSLVVAAPMAGRLLGPTGGAVPTPGRRVGADAELLRLIPLTPPDQDLRRLQTEAGARLGAAESQAERAAALLDGRAGSAREHELAQAELTIARAELEAVDAQLSLLGRTTVEDERGELGTVPLLAPFAGRVQRLLVAPGQLVAASTPLFELFDDDPLWIRVPVYAGDLNQVDRDRTATVRRLSVAEDAPGVEVSFVDGPPAAEPDAATVDLFLRLPNADGLYQPGQKVAVTLPLGGDTPVLVAPVSAILHDALGGTWVYRRDAPRTYVRQRVDIADVVDGYAVLARGGELGVEVVTVGAPELFGTEFGVDH